MKNWVKNNLHEIFIVAVISVVNILFTSLPLLNILSYESSVLNAVLFSLLFGVYFLKRKKTSQTYQLKFFFIVVSIPVIVLSISTILCQSCPLNDGIYFYLIISIPSIFVGIAIAKLALFISNKFKYLIFVFLWLISFFAFLPELYFNPQIYFYNPIFAYYPGVIYDQNISITFTLIKYRMFNIIFSIAIIAIIAILHSKKNVNYFSKVIVISVAVVFYLSFYFFKPALGLSTDLNKIKSELTEEIITENFRIIIPSSISVTEKKLIEYQHEYYFYAIQELLETKPDTKITSILFNSSAQKKRLFGSANADVAKPWLNQIYINYDNYDGSLKHELAHIFSAKYADGLFNLPSNLNPGLIEGFAMAVENNYDDFDIDYLASLAYKNDIKISLASLFGSFSFFSNASSVSYIYAGSFLKYLATKFGWQKVKQIYSGGNFKLIFNTDVTTLEKEYFNYLDTLSIKLNSHTTNYYFGRLPLIKKFCARATAKELKYAGELFYKNEYKSASDVYLKVFNYSGTYSALVGFVRCKKKLGDELEAITFLKSKIQNYENTAYYYYLELLLADLYALNRNDNKAGEYYQKIIKQNPHVRYLRTAVVKNDLLLKNDSTLYKYIYETNFKKKIIFKKLKEKPTDNYLQMLTSIGINENEYSDSLKGVISEITNLHNFSSDTYFELGKLAFSFLDFDEAIKYGELALKDVSFEKKIVISEFLKKVKWIKKNYSKIDE